MLTFVSNKPVDVYVSEERNDLPDVKIMQAFMSNHFITYTKAQPHPRVHEMNQTKSVKSSTVDTSLFLWPDASGLGVGVFC